MGQTPLRPLSFAAASRISNAVRRRRPTQVPKAPMGHKISPPRPPSNTMMAPPQRTHASVRRAISAPTSRIMAAATCMSSLLAGLGAVAGWLLQPFLRPALHGNLAQRKQPLRSTRQSAGFNGLLFCLPSLLRHPSHPLSSRLHTIYCFLSKPVLHRTPLPCQRLG